MIKTRLTERLGLLHPVISAPMAAAAGGKLAAAVSGAGGLGFIGGGFGNAEWLETEFAKAGNQKIGCGMITWSLDEKPELLELILDHAPKAVFLSFGNPEPYAKAIHNSGALLICQIQTLRDAKHAIAIGADIIVAQGAEAGGHGESRATLTLVPEVADYMATNAPETMLCAAGGIADGRGLAAALMMGADGVLVGSRFWASSEAMVHKKMHQAAIDASGDETIRSQVMDVSRGLNWPSRYDCRVLKNGITDRWHDDLDGLRDAMETEGPRWIKAWGRGDPDASNTFVGEAAGMIRSIKPAAEILTEMVNEATTLLRGAKNYMV